MTHRSAMRLLGSALLFVFSTVAWVGAQNSSTLSFVNFSGENATVKVIGPTSGYVDVPNGATKTVNVQGGSYSIVVRYGVPGSFTYQRGDQFEVSESAYSVDRISITLHKVPNGNYRTHNVQGTGF